MWEEDWIDWLLALRRSILVSFVGELKSSAMVIPVGGWLLTGRKHSDLSGTEYSLT